MYTYCANNPIYYSDPTGHIAVVDDIVIAAAILVAGVVTTALSQPEVQEGLSTMINKASYAVEEFAENAASVIASAAISVASAVSEVTGISSAPVLAPPTGLKKKFSTLVDSNYNPYLAPWLGSMSIAETYARSKAISDATTDVLTKTKTFILPNDTVIYRWGSNSPGNLTPKEKDKYTGLSFSLVPPKNKAYVATTVATVNATGTLVAIRDGINHVSIIPNPLVGTLDEWIEEGSNHVCTQTLQSIVIKNRKNE